MSQLEPFYLIEPYNCLSSVKSKCQASLQFSVVLSIQKDLFAFFSELVCVLFLVISKLRTDVLNKIVQKTQCLNIQQVLCLLSLQWTTVTCWTAVLMKNPWWRVKNVLMLQQMSPCWTPAPSSHHCRSLLAWGAWPWSQRGCLCSTLMSFSRWNTSQT